MSVAIPIRLSRVLPPPPITTTTTAGWRGSTPLISTSLARIGPAAPPLPCAAGRGGMHAGRPQQQHAPCQVAVVGGPVVVDVWRHLEPRQDGHVVVQPVQRLQPAGGGGAGGPTCKQVHRQARGRAGSGVRRVLGWPPEEGGRGASWREGHGAGVARTLMTARTAEAYRRQSTSRFSHAQHGPPAPAAAIPDHTSVRTHPARRPPPLLPPWQPTDRPCLSRRRSRPAPPRSSASGGSTCAQTATHGRAAHTCQSSPHSQRAAALQPHVRP